MRPAEIIGVYGHAVSSSRRSALSADSVVDRVEASSTVEPLKRLLAGNRRFAAGAATRPRQGRADARRLAYGQRPFAVVLACSDSYVAPELLFDHGIGDLFDVRVAGHVVDDVVLGSVEYALAEFSPPVLLVLGHEGCGAIGATVAAVRDGTEPEGNVVAVVDALRPAVAPAIQTPGDPVDNAVRANVAWQLRALWRRSPLVRHLLDGGALALVGARYAADTATVTLLTRGGGQS
jgi:carbonic anhydrase